MSGKHLIPALLWAVLLMWVSLMPGNELPEINLWQADKVFHVLFYLIFVVLLRFGWKVDRRPKILFATFSIAVSYGIMIEILQGEFVKNRYFDIFDIGANAVGAAIGLYIPKRLKR